MSKKKKRSKTTRWSKPRVDTATRSNVAAAMRAANQRGSYGSSIAAREMARAFGARTLDMYAKKPKPKLSKAEKAARARVRKARSAYATNAARAARLPGKRAGKKVRHAATAPAAARKPKKPKVPTVTAESVINKAQKNALVRYLCEGARRSGCGGGGSRVVTGKGSFERIRPPRFMTAG